MYGMVNKAGEEYGEDRLRRLLADAARARLPADTCLQALRKAVRDFAGSRGAGST